MLKETLEDIQDHYTTEFKEIYRNKRYKIEAKNVELKKCIKI